MGSLLVRLAKEAVICMQLSDDLFFWSLPEMRVAFSCSSNAMAAPRSDWQVCHVVFINLDLRQKLWISHKKRMSLSCILSFFRLVSVGHFVGEHLASFTLLHRTHAATRIRKCPGCCGLTKGAVVKNSTSIACVPFVSCMSIFLFELTFSM